MKYARKEKNVKGTELQKHQQMGKEKKRGGGGSTDAIVAAVENMTAKWRKEENPPTSTFAMHHEWRRRVGRGVRGRGHGDSDDPIVFTAALDVSIPVARQADHAHLLLHHAF